MRRLDRLSRQGERLQRDVTISVEALALFVHYWLTLIPTFPESSLKRPRRRRGASALSRSSRPLVAGSRAGRTFCAKSH